MQDLTAEGRRALDEIAARHGVSTGAAEALLAALVAGGGTQAQFSHPDLGGMGQWSRGGMLMIGDMFNDGLKAKVSGLASDLADLLARGGAMAAPRAMHQQSQYQGGAGGVSLFVPGAASGGWWPEGLGAPSSTGSQNNLRYAVFPASRRLAVDIAGKVTVYDTGDHAIGGVSQAQSGDQTLSFTSQHGLVRLSDLPHAGERPAPPAPAPTAAARTAEPAPAQERPPVPPAVAPAPALSPAPAAAPGAQGDVIGLLERLAGLREKGILSDEEFAAKKAELLSRL